MGTYEAYLFGMQLRFNTKFIITSLMIIILFLGIRSIYFGSNYPLMSVYVNDTDENQFYIDYMHDQGFGHELGLRVGDKVISVNGQSPEDFAPLRNARELEQAKQIIVSREGEELIFDTAKFEGMNSSDLVSLLIAAFFLGTSVYLFIFNNKRLGSVILLLSLAFFVFSLLFISQPGSSRGDFVLKYITTNSIILFPVMLWHFFALAFQRVGYSSRMLKYFGKMYDAILILAILRLCYFLPYSTYYILVFERVINLILFSVCILLIIGFIIRALIRYKEVGSIRLFILRLFRILIASFVPIMLFSFLPVIIDHDTLIPYTYSSLFLLFLPIGLTMLVTRKNAIL